MINIKKIIASAAFITFIAFLPKFSQADEIKRVVIFEKAVNEKQKIFVTHHDIDSPQPTPEEKKADEEYLKNLGPGSNIKYSDVISIYEFFIGENVGNPMKPFFQLRYGNFKDATYSKFIILDALREGENLIFLLRRESFIGGELYGVIKKEGLVDLSKSKLFRESQATGTIIKSGTMIGSLMKRDLAVELKSIAGITYKFSYNADKWVLTETIEDNPQPPSFRRLCKSRPRTASRWTPNRRNRWIS